MRDLLMQTGEALFGPRFQGDLADALGVSVRTMRRWVAGDFEPPETLKPELAALLKKHRARIDRLLEKF